MLKYQVTKGNLVSGKTYIACVREYRTYSREDIVEQMLACGSTVGKADILAVMELEDMVICNIIADGDAVNTPMYRTVPSVSGHFDGIDDQFHPTRHKVSTNIIAGKRLEKATSKIKLTKSAADSFKPYITGVEDMFSESVNDSLTPGGAVKVSGYRLKISDSDPQCGLFLRGTNGVTVQLAKLFENLPSRLLAVVPKDVPAGLYNIEVRTMYVSGYKLGKKVKTAVFDKQLRIEN